MSTILIRMKQHQVDELGRCIEQGLSNFGKAMSIYEDMKQCCDGSMHERYMNEDYHPNGMRYRMYPHMRDDWDNMPEERRYTRY